MSIGDQPKYNLKILLLRISQSEEGWLNEKLIRDTKARYKKRRDYFQSEIENMELQS